MTSSQTMADTGYRRELGDGLVLRWSTAEDCEGLAQLAAQVFRDGPDDPPDTSSADWTRDLISGRHPLIGPTDFAVVEDTRNGTLVALTCLLSQTWTYGGIDLPVGRPESVGTHEDYRRRGLIRAIFELIHARSAALGHLAQGITGIPYYYRQFGYEYALDFEGNRPIPWSAIPHLKEGEDEPFHLRDATPDDIPMLMELYDRGRAYALTSTKVDERYWHWLLVGAQQDTPESWRIYIIVDGAQRPCGYVATVRRVWREGLNVGAIGVAEGVSLAATLPSVLRALRETMAADPRHPESEPAGPLLFSLGRTHAVYEALGDMLPPEPRHPYPWYVRVPDLPALVGRIAPVLERRLHASAVAGHSGEVKLDFYRGGLRLVFRDGHLETVADWQSGAWDKADAGFPPGVFLQLLFGYRGLDELRDVFPDVWADGMAVPLLRALFPAQPSWVLPLD
ncbi:MAG TPA: GNAT family N-acetyltransferase [Chloroflexota bacterium]|nr:GNAT family N-acetyltransferase [Chloroflexota bacterium]